MSDRKERLKIHRELELLRAAGAIRKRRPKNDKKSLKEKRARVRERIQKLEDIE